MKANQVKNFRKYLSILSQNVLTESEISLLKCRCNHLNRSLDMVQQQIIRDIVNEHEYNITKEQTEKGLKYLLENTFRKDGTVRQLKKMPFGEHEIEILKSFKKFTFIGLDVHSWQNAGFYAPVYRVYSKDGSYFDYIADTFSEIEVI